MAGLVGYASSDEDDDTENQQAEEPRALQAADTSREAELEPVLTKPPGPALPAPTDSKEAQAVTVGPSPQNAVPLGPSLPDMDDVPFTSADGTSAPSSPYSANRAIVQELTLPSVPQLDIPPSPPGSPPPGANRKFEQFLALKRKGVHFNAKLEQSTALRNPSLMDKLMGFVEIEGRAQYETTLPSDLWDPAAFPDCAFRDRLRKSREAVAKERETEKTSGGRGSVDFVPSSSTPNSGTASTGGGLAKGEKRKSGWK